MSQTQLNIEHAPLVVHSHNLSSWQYAAMAARLAGVPHVHTEHGTNPHSAGWVNRWRTRWLVKRTDRLVAVSENTAEALVQEHGIARSSIDVVRNGVSPSPSDLRPPSSDLRASLGIPENATVIGSVGRLAHVKGYDRLIRAFAELVKSYSLVADVDGKRGHEIANGAEEIAPVGCPSSDLRPPTSDLHLLLVGDGPSRAELELLAAELGVAGDVTFAGFMSNARDALSALDLFVLPSRSEGLPVALLEAMAAGVPVAATPVGEVPEVLEHGKSGVILPDDETQWPRVLNTELCRDEDAVEQRLARVRYARDRVVESYSQQRTLAMYEDLYRQVGRRNRR